MAITLEAQQQMADHFVNSPYIGSAQIYDEKETGLGKHKFYYLGYHDIFGVEMPARGRRRGVEFQIWTDAWVRRHLPKLNQIVREARAGKYLHVRHNIRLKKRAIEHGQEFFPKPQWNDTSKKATVKKAEKLPVRKRKRKRRKLRI